MFQRAFTLIELLIVVAIIAILAAIAVPNFLEAQTRAKVSRVKNDLRAVSTALESYVVDHQKFPPDNNDWSGLNGVRFLTTPQAYMTTYPLDPFNLDRVGTRFMAYQYMNYEIFPSPTGNNFTWGKRALTGNLAALARRGTLVKSVGPDKFNDDTEWIIRGMSTEMGGGARGTRRGIDRLYDPTNGTVSWGDVVRLSGDTGGLPQQP